MEKGSGDPQFLRHGRPSSCYKHYTQSTTALWFLVFMMNLGWVLSTRNTTIVYNPEVDSTYGFRGVWNETVQRSINHCQKFHPANASDYFYYWPEDDPKFHFCCQFLPQTLVNTTDYQNISDYIDSTYGYYVGTATYYDLGIINSCFPFWNCKRLNQRYLDTPIFVASCEEQGVIALFQNRFTHLVIWKYGLLQTALPAIALLELCVFLIILGELLYMKYHRYDTHFTKLDIKPPPWSKEAWTIFKKWFGFTYRVMLMDWLHICLLSFVGNGLLDAVGRADPFLWTSKLFYDYTKVYLALLIILCISSALQQVAQWIAVDKRETWKFEEHNDDEETGHANLAHKEFQVAQNPHVEKRLCSSKEKDDPLDELQELLRLTPDWKWQPIAAQAAILFCVWGFLTYIVTEGTASTVLGFVVQAASPWSGLYALRVSFITVPFIISQANNVTTLYQVGRKVKNKFWPSKVDKEIKQKSWPTMNGVHVETRKSGLEPEGLLPANDDDVVETETPSLTAQQGPLHPNDDDVVETETPILTAQQDPLPPNDDDVVETETPSLTEEQVPLSPQDDVVVDKETSHLRLDNGTYRRRTR